MYVIRIRLSQDGSHFIPCGPLDFTINLVSDPAQARKFAFYDVAEDVIYTLPDTIRRLASIEAYNPGH